MRRLASTLAATCLASLALAAPAGAAFGLNNFDVTFTEADGSSTPAGAHPFAMTISLGTNLDGDLIPEGWLRDLAFEQIPGLVGDTTAYPRCSAAEFLAPKDGNAGGPPACPLETQIGIIGASAHEGPAIGLWNTFSLFNVAPPPGVLLRLGFRVATQNVFFDARLSETPPYNAVGASRNTPQIVNVFGSKAQLWGNPSHPGHNELRGECGEQSALLSPGDIEGFQFKQTGESCPVAPRPEPFLTLPTDCSAPLVSRYEALSWNDRDGDGVPDTDEGFRLTHDSAGNPAVLRECGKLDFLPSIDARPTTRAAQSPTGLDFNLEVDDEGLLSADGRRQAAIRKAVVTLPNGMTANPSLAEGLEVCTEEDLADETLQAQPGEGCPEASKIGTLEVETPLVEEPIDGSIFIAEPYENEFGSLIAFYMVFKSRDLGIIFKQSAEGVPDPKTGQLVTIVEDIPQVAVFSRVNLHLREGGRSPLVSPPLCDSDPSTPVRDPYRVSAVMTPWSGGAPHTATSDFEIVSGPNESPCPAAGTPPFEPGFTAGAKSNAAGAFSPFSMRLTRRDGDQDLTRFDATLPPGVVAKLAGVSKCSDAQIARARVKSGKAEQASPSCPAGSRIGGVTGGGGVGSQLTYVRGNVYMAGPFRGASLSAVAIVPAVAGPFDVGTIVYRQALNINPRTGEVSADGADSDPLPHILAGVPISVRDVQVHIDRPEFTLNPTSCDPFATRAAIWGGGVDPFSIADDSPVAREARYQAANCAGLGFKPRLQLRLKGGTERGDHPRLRGTYKPRPGDANLEGLVLRLPRSAFLDQAHIRTICTRVQFAADACPKGAIYGRARAFTPLLSEPLEGPVYLRSSNHNLPDFVASLHGIVDVETVARIDSKRGGIRATFSDIPDAPLTKVVVRMQGGQKGLIINSTDLCAVKHRANARFEGHNGKRHQARPAVGASCGAKK